jgi:hypothetical protein
MINRTFQTFAAAAPDPKASDVRVRDNIEAVSGTLLNLTPS